MIELFIGSDGFGIGWREMGAKWLSNTQAAEIFDSNRRPSSQVATRGVSVSKLAGTACIPKIGTQ